jgi:hypothetical protein
MTNEKPNNHTIMTTKEEKCHPKTGNTSFSPNLILFFFPLFPYIFFDIKIKKKKKTMSFYCSGCGRGRGTKCCGHEKFTCFIFITRYIARANTNHACSQEALIPSGENPVFIPLV